MKRVLITGARGFVGRHCIRPLLEANYEVLAVTSSADVPRGKDHLGVSWLRADLLDADQIMHLVGEAGADELLHLAWVTTPGEYWTSPSNEKWVDASLLLLEAFANRGGNRAVLVGTCAEYDWSSGICDEHASPMRANSPYSRCKANLRQRAESLAGAMNVSLAWARLFFIYGPNEAPEKLIPSVIRSILRGKTAPCSEGMQRRDFLHVEDAASALVALLRSELNGAVNVGSGQASAVRDVALSIGRLLQRPELVQLGAQPARDEPPLVQAGLRRLRGELGFEPSRDLEAGLEATIAWWREEAGLAEMPMDLDQSSTQRR